MAIMHGFDLNGNFVAVDTATHAADRGFKGSKYWRDAKSDPEATAQEMIASTLEFRQNYPDMPSHDSAIWDANFFALAQMICR